MLNSYLQYFSVSRKRKHYLGDFNEDDMNSPRKARKLLLVAQNESKSLRKKIKKIKDKNNRLEKRVFTLKEMIVQLKKKRLVSQPAVNILEVKRKIVLFCLLLFIFYLLQATFFKLCFF